MSKFSTGLMMGTILSATGLMLMLSDKKSRTNFENKSSKLLNKTSDVMSDVVNSL